MPAVAVVDLGVVRAEAFGPVGRHEVIGAGEYGQPQIVAARGLKTTLVGEGAIGMTCGLARFDEPVGSQEDLDRRQASSC